MLELVVLTEEVVTERTSETEDTVKTSVETSGGYPRRCPVPPYISPLFTNLPLPSIFTASYSSDSNLLANPLTPAAPPSAIRMCQTACRDLPPPHTPITLYTPTHAHSSPPFPSRSSIPLLPLTGRGVLRGPTHLDDTRCRALLSADTHTRDSVDIYGRGTPMPRKSRRSRPVGQTRQSAPPARQARYLWFEKSQPG